MSGGLQEALSEFVHAVGRMLAADVAAGAEVELELCARGGRGARRTPFYSYQPLTGTFIAQRESEIARLTEYEAAADALANFEGLERYLSSWDGSPGDLRDQGILVKRREPPAPAGGARTRARRGLRLLLEEIFAEQTDFEVRPERLAEALGRLERAEPGAGENTIMLVATLHGLTIASEEIKLTRGLTIATPSALSWAPQAAIADLEFASEHDGAEHLLVALTCGDAEEDEHELLTARSARQEAAIAQAQEVLADLLRALRLFGDGRVTLGSLGWTRAGGEGRWSAVSLGTGGRPHGMLVVPAEQEDELRAFCNLVSRRAPHGNELAWALRRFELGCERASAYEGLTDHLLALRALLEPEGPASGMLAGRIAALCATPDDRAKLTERMTKALALERAIVAGTATERAAGLALARDVSDHLRALLRDVICGHLAADLAGLADELLSPQAPDAPDEGAAVPRGGAQQILVEA